MRPRLYAIGHKVNSLLSGPSLSTCETWLLPQTYVLCMTRNQEEGHGTTTSIGQDGEDTKREEQEEELLGSYSSWMSDDLWTTDDLRTSDAWRLHQPDRLQLRQPTVLGRPPDTGRLTLISARTIARHRTSNTHQRPDDRRRPDVRHPPAPGRPAPTERPTNPHPCRNIGVSTLLRRPVHRKPSDIR